MESSDKKKISRRTFLKKGKKLVYLTPAIYTFFTHSKEAIAQGRAAAQAAAVDRAAARLEAAAAAGNQAAAVALQNLQEAIVSPP